MFVGTNSNRVIPPDSPLTMASVMAHGFGRLLAKGKFGSMRKQKISSRPTDFGKSSPSTSSSESTLLDVDDEPSRFPVPSFIRPKMSRMLAREEKSPSCKRLNDTLELQRSSRLSRRFSASESYSSGTGSIRSSVRSRTRSSTPRIPRRSSSLVTQHREEHPSLASLLHYELTDGESRNANHSLSLLCAPASHPDPTYLAQLEKTLSLDDSPPTPPPKDEYPLQLSLNGGNPVSPRRMFSPGAAPRKSLQANTPRKPIVGLFSNSRSVPDLVGRAASQQDPTAEAVFKRERPSKLVLETPRPGTALRIRKTEIATQSPILQEPAVGDFLGLSDDDIAEERPSTPLVLKTKSHADGETVLGSELKDLEKPAPPPKSPGGPSQKLSVECEPTTPSPTVAAPTPLSVKRISARLSMGTSEDRAAAMAAFEVARIASRYSFDLIYVIDMWPKHMIQRKTSMALACDSLGAPGLISPVRRSASVRSSTHSRSTSTRSAGSLEAHDETSPCSGSNGLSDCNSLDYRFLAAYGLHTVKPPLEIAFGVHSKILKHDGWIEYRQSERNDNEFARGYACSFYTGCAPTEERHTRNPSLGSASEASIDENSVAPSPRFEKDKLPATLHSASDRSDHNRGIVFAGYRKQKSDGETPGLSREELRSMQLDAETLVNMIVDCHKVKRRSEQQLKPDTRPRRTSMARASADEGTRPRASV